jgi:endonuclease/exonuclease/phosphatase family metal-dependent hydrolase
VNETGNFLLTCQADSRDKNHRSIFWGRISTGSFELICGNLHWSYEPANQMSNASETLDFIDRHIEENLLLIGDFNCTAQEPPLRQLLTGALTDAWQKMNPKQPGFTYPAINPQKRIDLALFNHRLADRILNVSLNGSEKLSDHLALVIDLDLK